MPSISAELPARLQRRLGLVRAVETGTWRGDGAIRLAEVFEHVVTVELSKELHASASERLRAYPNVQAVQGHSVQRLEELAQPHVPTFWFLDGHWSAGGTAGEEDECPVLDELRLLESGHEDDVIVVDDARYFTAAPPPPHDPAKWPTLIAILDVVRAVKPGHHVTLLDDQIIAAPLRAKADLDDYGRSLAPQPRTSARLRAVLATARGRVGV